MTNNLPVRNDEEKIKFCDDTIKLFVQTQYNFLNLAERMKAIRDQGLFAPKWGSFADFTLEVNEFSMSMINRLINIHEKFVLTAGIEEKDLSEAGWTKLAMTLPFVHTKDEAIHWAEQAKALTKSDLRKELAELKTGKKMATCKHEESYLLRVCPECKDKWREVDVSVISTEEIEYALAEAGVSSTEDQRKIVLDYLVKNSREE
jgi:hypothetical protein